MFSLVLLFSWCFVCCCYCGWCLFGCCWRFTFRLVGVVVVGYELFVFLYCLLVCCLFGYCVVLIGLIIVYCELLSGFVDSVGLYDSC